MTGLDVEAVLRRHFWNHSDEYYVHVAAVLRVEIGAWLRSEATIHAAADAAFLGHTGRPLDKSEAEVIERDGEGYLRDLWEGWMRAGQSALADQLDPYRPTLAADEGD